MNPYESPKTESKKVNYNTIKLFIVYLHILAALGFFVMLLVTLMHGYFWIAISSVPLYALTTNLLDDWYDRTVKKDIQESIQDLM